MAGNLHSLVSAAVAAAVPFVAAAQSPGYDSASTAWDAFQKSDDAAVRQGAYCWMTDHKWRKCQREGTHWGGGFDLTIPNELDNGIKDCIYDAIEDFSNGDF